MNMVMARFAALKAVAALVVFLSLWPLAARAQFFDDSVRTDYSTRGAESSPQSRIQVSAPVAVNSIAVLTNITTAHQMKFIIYNFSSSSFVYLGAAESFAADASGVFSFKRSANFPMVTLVPGQDYMIGAISDVAGLWAFSTSGSFTQNNVTSTQTNGNASGFASPTLAATGGARIPLRLYADNNADLAITKTDGVTTATAGGSVTYTITASNAGPGNASGATVADTFPAVLTGTWTCVGAGGGTCTAAGSGNINDTVNLPAGGSVTYTVSATVSPAATGTLSNTATVAAPAGVTDPTPGNNSATDTDTITQSADLAITKTDGVTSVVAGGSVTYTITASNAGPSNASGATVADTLPAILTGGTWTCVAAGGGTCTASGSGNINDTVNLPAGGSVTYTVSATVSPAATGTLSNTATVSAPAGVTDPNPGNNSATDTDTIGQSGDLAVTLTGPAGSVTAGDTVVYTLAVGNSGPSNATGATVTSTLAPAPTSVNWTCVGSGGASCPASGSGNINGTATLPSGGSVVYTITAVLPINAATGTLDASASVTAPAGYTDTAPLNNSATASNALAALVVNPVPSLSVWALLLLSLGLLAVGRSTWRRREG